MIQCNDFGDVEVTVRARIRACQEDDLPALEWMGLFSHDREIIRNAFEEQKRGEGLMLLAVAKGFPIAQVWISFKRRNRMSLAKLWAVRTFHPLQRTGIGRRMMQVAECILAEREVQRAELEVEPSDREILGFYRGLGWKIVSQPTDLSDGRTRFLLGKNVAAS